MSYIGMWSSHAQVYVLILTVVTFFAFSTLIFFRPLLWARMLLWKLPEETDLTIYFARCLGAFAIVTNLMLLRAGLNGTGLALMLEFFTLFCLLMVVVHIWGAVEGTQPITETLEIGFWAGLVVLNLLFYPGLASG